MKKKINQDFIDLTDLINVVVYNKKKILLFFIINILAIILYSKHLTKDFYFKSNMSFQLGIKLINYSNKIDLSIEEIIEKTNKYLIDYQIQSNNEMNFEIDSNLINNIKIDLVVNNVEKKKNEEFFISIKNYLNQEFTNLIKLYIERYRAKINEEYKINLLVAEQKEKILKKNLEYEIHYLRQNYEIAKKLNIKKYDKNLDFEIVNENPFWYGYEIIDMQIKLKENLLEDIQKKEIQILQINQNLERDLIKLENLSNQIGYFFQIISTPLIHEKVFKYKFRNIFYVFPIFITFLFIIFLLILNIFRKLENSKK